MNGDFGSRTLGLIYAISSFAIESAQEPYDADRGAGARVCVWHAVSDG